jgi:ABC-type hemin transport system ATPase subunit
MALSIVRGVQPRASRTRELRPNFQLPHTRCQAPPYGAPFPRILFLDEATSALDNITQKHVAEALGRLKSTRVVIAHRLSTIRQCDRIIVLEKGRIVEDGAYDDLIAKGGIFAELIARQRLGSL